MKKIHSLTNEQKLKLEKIAKNFNLKLIIMFGSFASGKNREDSDLDIAVLAVKEISFEKQIRLSIELANIFNKNIDLSILNHANPLHLFQVSKNAILLFGTSEEFYKFKLHAFRLYNDYAPYFKMERDINKKIINAYAS